MQPERQPETSGAALLDTPDPGSGTDEKRELRRRLEIFLGENPDVYLEFYDKYYLEFYGKYFKEGEKHPSALSWHWPALLVTLPWLWYRKLYLWGVGLLLIMPALGLLAGARVGNIVGWQFQ